MRSTAELEACTKGLDGSRTPVPGRGATDFDGSGGRAVNGAVNQSGGKAEIVGDADIHTNEARNERQGSRIRDAVCAGWRTVSGG